MKNSKIRTGVVGLPEAGLGQLNKKQETCSTNIVLTGKVIFIKNSEKDCLKSERLDELKKLVESGSVIVIDSSCKGLINEIIQRY